MITAAKVVWGLFALIWAVIAVAGAAVPVLGASLPGIGRAAAGLVTTWAGAQAGPTMALAAMAWLGAVAARRGGPSPSSTLWPALCLLMIPAGLALSALQFAPGVVVQVRDATGSAYPVLRAHLPTIRLALFVGTGCIALAALAGGRNDRRAVVALTLTAWAAMVVLPQDRAALALALPGAAAGIVVLRAGRGAPALPFAVLGLGTLAAGLILMVTGAAGDIAPLYAAPVLLTAVAARGPVVRRWHWGLAGAVAILMTFLTPRADLFGLVPQATTFAEIAQAVARVQELRSGAGAGLVVIALAGMASLAWERRRRVAQRHRPAPAAQGRR